MSAKASGEVWDLRLEPMLKLTLLAYVDHANHDGGDIFPSIDRIRWKTGESEREVQYRTRDLETMGLLVPDGKGPRGTNKYRFPVGHGQDILDRWLEANPSPDNWLKAHPGGARGAPVQGVHGAQVPVEGGARLGEGGGARGAPELKERPNKDTDKEKDDTYVLSLANGRLQEVLDAVLGNDRALWVQWRQYGGTGCTIRDGVLLVAVADPVWCSEHLGRLMENQLAAYDPALSIVFFSIGEEVPDA